MNDDNKIIFTKDELTELLDEVYMDGYRDGNKHWYTWTSPTVAPTWRYTTTSNSTEGSSDKLTFNNNSTAV